MKKEIENLILYIWLYKCEISQFLLFHFCIYFHKQIHSYSLLLCTNEKNQATLLLYNYFDFAILYDHKKIE